MLISLPFHIIAKMHGHRVTEKHRSANHFGRFSLLPSLRRSRPAAGGPPCPCLAPQARIDALEKQKADAIDREDYHAAKLCKQEIDMLKAFCRVHAELSTTQQMAIGNLIGNHFVSGCKYKCITYISLVREREIQKEREIDSELKKKREKEIQR